MATRKNVFELVGEALIATASPVWLLLDLLFCLAVGLAAVWCMLWGLAMFVSLADQFVSALFGLEPLF